MADSTTSSSSSVSGFPDVILAGQTFAFEMEATNNPTSWTAANLPVGLTLNAATGLISGAIAAPGVYSFQLTASNAGGDSAPMFVYLEVTAATPAPGLPVPWIMNDLSLTDVQFDLRLRGISSTFAGASSGSSSSGAAAAASGSIAPGPQPTPTPATQGIVLTFIQDDTCKLALILWTPTGQVSDATTIWLTATTAEDSYPVIDTGEITGSAALTTVTGGNYYLIALDLTSDLITQAMDDLPAPSGGIPRMLTLETQIAVQRGAQIARSLPFTIQILQRITNAGAPSDCP
jgi:PKD repeat protein